MTLNTQEDSVLSQYVPGFRANLNMAPQQTDSRLLGAVESDLSYDTPGEMFNGDDLLATDPEDAQGRVPDTPDKFPQFARRVGFFTPFHDSAWLDNVDKAREMTDPTSPVMSGMMAGRWRKADSGIVAGMLGVAYTKADSSAATGVAPVAVAFPSSQVIASTDVSMSHDGEVVPTGGQQYGMSIGKLIYAKMLLDDSDLEGERYIAVGPQQVADLLRRTPATSSYYAEVKALNAGTITKFLGFNFIQMPRKRFLTSAGHDSAQSIRRIPAWIKPAVIYKARPITNASIRIRTDKSDTPQAFYKAEQGAMRRYDQGVVEIDCYEGAAY